MILYVSSFKFFVPSQIPPSVEPSNGDLTKSKERSSAAGGKQSGGVGSFLYFVLRTLSPTAAVTAATNDNNAPSSLQQPTSGVTVEVPTAAPSLMTPPLTARSQQYLGSSFLPCRQVLQRRTLDEQQQLPPTSSADAKRVVNLPVMQHGKTCTKNTTELRAVHT